MRVPKWAGLVLAVLLVASGVILYAAVNLDSYLTANREVIAERVSRAIGRPVRFERLDLSVGRGLGIAVRTLAVGEDPRFGAGDFLSARDAFVQIRILPALFGRYEVARVSLESPTISLVRTADGTNFEALSAGEDEPDDGSSAQSRAIAVALLDVEDGTVRYLDRTEKPAREVTATQLEFHASDLSFGDALRFELSAAVLGASAPNITASGAVGPVDPQDVGATPLDVTLQLDDVDGDALRAALPAPSDLRIEGPITAKLELGGTVAAWTLNFAANSGQARVRYAGVLDKPRNVELTVSGHLARRDDDTIIADTIEIATTSSTLTIRGSAVPKDTALAYAVTLNGAGVSLADWASLLPALADSALQGHADVALDVKKAPAAASPSIDGRIGLDGVGARFGGAAAAVSQLSGVLSFKGRSATLAPSDLRVGGVPARFGAHVDDVFAPVVAFQLSSPSFPLSVITTTEGDDALQGLDASGRASLTGRTPALDADVRADAASIGGLAMKSLRAKVSHASGRTRIDPIAFDSCGGNLRGSVSRVTAQGASAAPRIEVEVHAAGVNIAELTTALTGGHRAAPASGTLTFEVVAGGAGDDWPSLQRALDGRGRFDIADGAILGTNIPEATLERVTGVPGLSALLPPRLRADFPALFEREDTRFDALTAAFLIANGRLQTQDLAVKAHDFAIDAAGTIGLDLAVDLAATLTTSPELSSRLVAEAAAARHLANREGRIAIPFRLAGIVPGVKPQPDPSALAAKLQRGLVDAIGEKLLDGGKKARPEPPPAP